MHKKKCTNELPLLSLGDIIDRLSILTRKVFRGEEDAYKELESLRKGLNTLGYNGDVILASLRLAHQNWAIWDLENSIRKLGDPVAKFGLEEIGRRAMQIRDFNKKRITYKNDLNTLDGNSYKEFKIEHRAQ
jgi:hypothetical protein